MEQKIAIIIGAGPAGLTAAYELLEKTQIIPIVFESDSLIGGISKTVNYKGNRIDIGGHRFFSRSDKVMDWWENILPLQGKPSIDDIILERTISFSPKTGAPDPEKDDLVMLVRKRISRIFFKGKFFDYPVSLSHNTISNLGIIKIIRIGISYLFAQLFPIKNEKSLEDFFINRFGRELYRIFFRDYTEKVWGIPCSRIKPEWGAQRIKGISVTKVITHAVKNVFQKKKINNQKKIETSLIEQFLYPKFGPGQLWEEAARKIRQKGGSIILNNTVTGINNSDNLLKEVTVKDNLTNQISVYKCDYVLSSMPVKDLIPALGNNVPENIKNIAGGLKYRNFITVGLLLKKLNITNHTKIPTINNIVPDNWIYIQEREVKVGRLQIFNNWSPYLVNNPDTVWIGLEYFCDEGDDLWKKSEQELTQLGINELARINIIKKDDVLDSTIVRMPKAYPAYFGSYNDIQLVRNFTDKIENLFLIGRNGMHKYNNADHSMLTAMAAVENINNNVTSKENIWSINAEETYHEEK